MVSKPSNLNNLVTTGALKIHQPTLPEIMAHLTQAKDSLNDISWPGASASGKFKGPYDAAHQLGLGLFHDPFVFLLADIIDAGGRFSQGTDIIKGLDTKEAAGCDACYQKNCGQAHQRDVGIDISCGQQAAGGNGRVPAHAFCFRFRGAVPEGRGQRLRALPCIPDAPG